MAKLSLTLALAVLCLLQVATAASVPAAATKYNGHKVIRVKNPSQTLLDHVSSSGLDAWGRGADFIDLRVRGPADLAALQAAAGGKKVDYTVVVDNVQAVIDADRASHPAASTAESVSAAAVNVDLTWFNDYHRYPEIVEFVKTACAKASGICSFTPSIGKSVQGRDLVALKIGTPAPAGGAAKPQVYIQGSQHAREWAATATVQYIVHQLLTSTDARVKSLLDKVDVHVVPLGNPDGYEYSWTGDRLWRKNRRDNGDGTFGVDLNRNWAWKWGQGGASQYTDDDTYQGPRPESEPEVQALAGYIRSLPRVVAAIDVHTFSQLLLRPWGDTSAASKHEAEHKAITTKMAATIKSVSGKAYTPQTAYSLYKTTGSASDYFYSLTKSGTSGQSIRPYGITIELRPTSSAGSSGFILPKEQILPTGKEVFPAFLDYAENGVAKQLAA
ncbi:hypothetical protein H9P43_005529 [Blastocladiella emersonii ATCC 22665]|nr:hypothetical protein H9P43_005529 [Blastocladiella emersonii ATCC 22665]